MRISRDIENWGWYKDSNTFRVFFHLLLKAKYQKCEFLGGTLERGQIDIGRKKIASDLGITEQKVRTALEHLQKTGEITIKSTNKFSIVTICKYERWQCDDEESNQQNNQQTTIKKPQLKEIKRKKVNNKLLSSKEDASCENRTCDKNVTIEDKKNIDVKSDNTDINTEEHKSLNARARDVFIEYYNSINENEYYWKAKDAGSMSSILNAIKNGRKRKGLDNSDDNVLNALRFLLESISDQWILSNLSVSIIFSKYNEIVASIPDNVRQEIRDSFNDIKRIYDKDVGDDMLRRWSFLSDKDREEIFVFVPKYVSLVEKPYRQSFDAFLRNRTWKNKEITTHGITVRLDEFKSELVKDEDLFVQFASRFNEKVQYTKIPQINLTSGITEKRRVLFNIAYCLHFFQIKDVIENAMNNPLLNGTNGFCADFDYIFEPNNFIRISEGK